MTQIQLPSTVISKNLLRGNFNINFLSKERSLRELHPVTWQRRETAAAQQSAARSLSCLLWACAAPLSACPGRDRDEVLTVGRRELPLQLPARDELKRPHLPDVDAFGHLENLLHHLRAVSAWIQQHTTLQLLPRGQPASNQALLHLLPSLNHPESLCQQGSRHSPQAGQPE